MKALVLAAGLGTRLLPLTQTNPKPLIPVNGKPLITYTLRYLKHYGISDIYINLHHLGEKIKNALGNGSSYGVKLTYSEEPIILGTGGAMKKLEKAFGTSPFLAINSDVLTDFPLSHLIKFHQQHGGLASLVLREDFEADRFGPIEIDSSGRIRTILKKGDILFEHLKKLMFTGIHLINAEVLQSIPKDVFHSIIDCYIDLLLRGKPLYGLEMKGFWGDLGTLEEYGRITTLVTEGKIQFPYI
ncbi:MAG: NDP-sugar synthase [Nitrospiria bacterium]